VKNSQNQPLYVDGTGWSDAELTNKSINVNYGDSYQAYLSYDWYSASNYTQAADFASFTCSEFYNNVWVPCFDNIQYSPTLSSWELISNIRRSLVSWSSITPGVSMIEFDLAFFANADPYQLLYLSTMRYNILYDGVPSYAVGVDNYDGTSQYVALHYVDALDGYCYYYSCSPYSLPGGGSIVESPGGGVVSQTGLLDWVAQLPIANVFAANVKAFISPFIDRFITPLQFDTTPLKKLRDYLYFVGVMFSTLDPVISMSLLSTAFKIIFILANLYLFISVWAVFRFLL